MARLLRSHLAGTLGHQTLCNVSPRRWSGKELVATTHPVVDLDRFKRMTPRDGQCGRCLIKMRKENL